MADETDHNEKVDADPTHILIADDTGEEITALYAWNNGEVTFAGGLIPERGKSYRLAPNPDFAV